MITSGCDSFPADRVSRHDGNRNLTSADSGRCGAAVRGLRVTSGFNLHTTGVILMIVGVIGLLLALFWTVMWADRRSRHREYVDRGVPPPAEPY